MKKEFFITLSIILLTKNIISEKSLTLQLKFSKNFVGRMTTILSDKTEFYISFSHSKIISNESSNLQNINITDDDCYPYKKAKNGTLGIKNFKFNQILNLNLNYVYVNGEKNYLGLSRRVEYDDKEIEGKYNLDFVSQLIEKKIIDKYYIYLPAFFNDSGENLEKLYITFGMIPNILDNYINFNSYIPLNTNYPNKWSVTLSHIIYEDTYDTDKPLNMTYSMSADVIFTNSGNRTIMVSYKYKDVFDDIFISHLNCQVWNGEYICDPNKINKFKLFFVFNGFSHLLFNELITYIFSGKKYFYINFSTNIDFIGIDTFTFGNYHFFFDGEKNFIRLMNKNEDAIKDVSNKCGYENRDGIQRKAHDMEYLLEWEEKLKNESKKINETLKEVEEMKIELEKQQKTLGEEIKLCKSDVLKAEVYSLRNDLEIKDKDKNVLNEEISKNKTLMIMIIVNIVLTVITSLIIIFCLYRTKRRANQNENLDFGLVDKFEK
jgi:hypothetical protein